MRHSVEKEMARLAAADMDGTLLMPDHHLVRVIATLSRLRERDITLTFATGRHVLEMRHILGTLSLDAYLITGNGTRIHPALEGDVLHRQDLDPQVADAVHHAQDTRAVTMCLMTTAGFTGEEVALLGRTSTAIDLSGYRYIKVFRPIR